MSANRHHNALAPGYRLHWYEIESVLGQGGFSITYLATDTNLAQSVAIKEFLPSDLAVRTRDSVVHPVSDARVDALRQVKLATFPNETLQSCYVPVGARIEDTALKQARTQDRVELVFSNAAGRFVPSIGHGRRLWQGTAVHKEPNLTTVAVAARDVGADAVLMGWYHCNTSPNVTEDTCRGWIYLVDLRTSRVTVRESPLLDIDKAVQALLQELFAVRGL